MSHALAPGSRVLVTGGGGFIGTHLSNTLTQRGYQVVVLENEFLGNSSDLLPEVTYLRGDAGSMEDLRSITPCDAIVHLAGSSSQPMFEGEGFRDAYCNSVQSFVSVLELAREWGVGRVLYASTSSLYGNNVTPLTEDQVVTPPNHYAVTKHLYEECAQCFCQVYSDIDVVGFRFMSVYGPYEYHKGIYANLLSQFLWDLSRGISPVLYGDGTQERDFTHVSDIVSALTLALEHDQRLHSEVFNIGRGEATQLLQAAQLLQGALGTQTPLRFIENPIKETYVRSQLADISHIQSVLGYAPSLTLEQGISDLVDQLDPERIVRSSSEQW